MAEQKSNGAALGMGIGSLVLGVVALCSAWMPLIGCFALPLAAIGVLLAGIGIIFALTTKGRGIGMPIAGGIINVVAIGIVILVTAATGSALESAAKGLQSQAQQARYQRAVDQIAQLESKKAESESARALLARLVVNEASFYRRSDLGNHPAIKLSVTNNTDQALSAVRFHVVLQTPGRSMPWVEDDFSYQIRGGLEPGESATWELSPNSFGGWSQAPKDRDDLELIVEAIRLVDAQNETIAEASFTDSDAQRLAELREIAENHQAE